MRSGVTISSRAPERAIISAADIAECVPLSSNSNTSPVGVTSPPSTSQLVTTRSPPHSNSGSWGRPPVATITTSGESASDVARLGDHVVADVDPEPGELGDPPLDDAQQVAPARIARRQPDLPAGPRHRLEHGHLVAALAGHPGRFQTRRSGADDDDSPGRAAPAR